MWDEDLFGIENTHVYQCAQFFRNLPERKEHTSSKRFKSQNRSYAQATQNNRNIVPNDEDSINKQPNQKDNSDYSTDNRTEEKFENYLKHCKLYKIRFKKKQNV